MTDYKTKLEDHLDYIEWMAPYGRENYEWEVNVQEELHNFARVVVIGHATSTSLLAHGGISTERVRNVEDTGILKAYLGFLLFFDDDLGPKQWRVEPVRVFAMPPDPSWLEEYRECQDS